MSRIARPLLGAARRPCLLKIQPEPVWIRLQNGRQVRFEKWLDSQTRGAKTSTSVKVKDLAQGALPALPELEPDDGPSQTYPPVIQQHLNHVKQFRDCIVLTRVGNFYEMYAEQAEEYGPLLNLKVAKRKTALGPVAMSGFQVFQLERYLKLLVQDMNKQVAISEEIPNTAAEKVKSGGLLYNRKVSRVITAGTLIDENFMDPYENNFLLSIHPEEEILDSGYSESDSAISSPADKQQKPRSILGLSWVDLSSGDFFVQQVDSSILPSVLARIAPREIVLDTALDHLGDASWKTSLAGGHHMLAYHELAEDADWLNSWNKVLDRPMTEQESQLSPAEVKSGSVLLGYVRTKLQTIDITLRPPVRRSEEDYMRIDKQSLRGLEIRETLRDGIYTGSLLHAIRRTVTKGGARQLVARLVSPSMSLEVIDQRLGVVSQLLCHDSLRENVVGLLKRSADTLRLLQKFKIGKGDADDLLALAKTIEVMQQLDTMLTAHVKSFSNPAPDAQSDDVACLRTLQQPLDLVSPSRLKRRIENSIDEDNLSRQQLEEEDDAAALTGFAERVEEADETGEKVKRPSAKSQTSVSANDADPAFVEIWIMRQDASPTLHRAHAELAEFASHKTNLSASLRAQLGRNSLTLRWSTQLGHFCHVKGKDTKKDLPHAQSIGSTKSTRSFYLPEWTSLGRQIEDAKSRIRAEEQRVFVSLRDEVIQNLVKLRRNASVLDELDIACSFAIVARERNWVRPILHQGRTHKIIGGRHPTVDLGLVESGRQFTSNDCFMNDSERILLITGPNMAGKSTYLRQNALISILAQTGSYVPAEYAEIGLVDKIFSRIGSADNLYNHQSTFMVEMVEVAEILNQATPRSFVIMDEVGRGTTPEDGVAVGFACLHHLHEKIKCRALFATHFHALADMTKDFDRLACYCTDVAEAEDGSWIYVHKLHRGVNRESHALKVAKLAGVPDDAIAVAKEAFDKLNLHVT